MMSHDPADSSSGHPVVGSTGEAAATAGTGQPAPVELTPEQIAAANMVLPDDASDDSPPDDLDSEGEAVDASILYGEPFEPRSFGGELVWARGDHFVAKILRVRGDQQVKVAGQRRHDMFLLLTGGRAVVEELTPEGERNRVELQPAHAFQVDVSRVYRLIALTDIELFTVYTEVG